MKRSLISKPSFLLRLSSFFLKEDLVSLNCTDETQKIHPDSHLEMTSTLLNYEQVITLANFNMELAKKLLAAFLEELKPLSSTLKAYPDDEDMVAISKLTHKLKPSLELLQLDSLNQKLNLYKMKYREGTAAGKAELPKLYLDVLQMCNQVEEEIQKYLSAKD